MPETIRLIGGPMGAQYMAWSGGNVIRVSRAPKPCLVAPSESSPIEYVRPDEGAYQRLDGTSEFLRLGWPKPLQPYIKSKTVDDGGLDGEDHARN